VPQLVIDGLTLHFGGVAALAGIYQEVNPGDILAVIGPNGAGKNEVIVEIGTRDLGALIDARTWE